MSKHTASNRLMDIKDNIKELVYEAKDLIRGNGSSLDYERARLYWVDHILTALDKENDYLGGSMFTMQDTINALDYNEYEDEDQKLVNMDKVI